MRTLPTALWIFLLAIASALADDDTVKFPSPDGRFAIFMGVWESRHYDSKTNDWVTDNTTKPAGIIEMKSRKVVLQFETPLRPEEDKAVWNAGSNGLALSHRGNKITEMKVYFLRDGSFKEVTLPELPEVNLQIKPPKNPDADQHVHFNHDTITPVRWLDSGELVVSRDKSLTDTTAEEATYQRTISITLSFDKHHKVSIKNVSREKQSVHVHAP